MLAKIGNDWLAQPVPKTVALSILSCRIQQDDHGTHLFDSPPTLETRNAECEPVAPIF